MAKFKVGDRVVIGDLDELGINERGCNTNKLLSLRECVVVEYISWSLLPYHLDSDDDPALSAVLKYNHFSESWLMPVPKDIDVANDEMLGDFIC